MEDYTQRIVKKGLFGVRYLYLNDNTRIRYGYSIQEMGIAYVLQRKRFFWQRVSWSYNSFDGSLDQVIRYLFWKEEEDDKRKPKPLF